MDVSQTPSVAQRPRWLGPCLPVWNHVYPCSSGFCGTHDTAFLLFLINPELAPAFVFELAAACLESSFLRPSIAYSLRAQVSPLAPLHPFTPFNIFQNPVLPEVTLYGWGKSRFTVVHMENNTVINTNTRINSVFHILSTFAPPCIFIHLSFASPAWM